MTRVYYSMGGAEMASVARGQYGEITDLALLGVMEAAMELAFELKLLPPPYKKVSNGQGDCLNYDLYDYRESDFLLLVQHRHTIVDKWGAQPTRRYFLLQLSDTGIVMTETPKKAIITRASKVALQPGDLLRLLEGKTTLSQLMKNYKEEYGRLPLPRERHPVEIAIVRWQAEGLLPQIGKDLLVWKHVTAEGRGNKGFLYAVDQPFEIPAERERSMACAGPMGALRDWRAGDENPHLIAIRTPRLAIRIRGRDGVFLFRTGTPVALYRATRIDEDTLDLQLLAGIDALALIR
jgi:hypothetical protein